MHKLYLDCQCESLEHSIRFYYEPDLECVVLDTHIIRIPLWKRIVYAIKYVFGYQSKYGAFDETLLNVDNIEELKEFLEQVQMEIING